MEILLMFLVIFLLLFIFYEQTNIEGFKIEDKYAHLSEKEKNDLILTNDAKLVVLYKKAKLSSLINNNKKSIEELSKPYPKYKIAFVTFENRDSKYIEIHDSNMEKYCNKWGYQYFRIKENKENISPYWYKVFVVNQFLETNKYDYVFWLDSDTVINNFNIDLGEDVLFRYNSDIFVASDNIKYDIVNAGLFIVKNSETGKKFMQDWMNLYLPMCENGNGKLKGTWAMSCYEQGTLNKIIIEKYPQNTTFLDSTIFMNSNNCNTNVFIMHYYAGDSKQRTACFAKAKH